MRQVDQVTRIVQDVVGEGLLGLYLHGSAVADGLRPASDLDVLGVTDGSLDQQGRAELCARVGPVSGPRNGARSVEVTLVVQADVVPWRYPATCDVLYGDWLMEEIATGRLPQRHPNPGLAIELSQVLDGDATLLGPPPDDLLDRPPAADIVRAGLEGIPALLLDLEEDTRNVLLTLARVWATVETGQVLSKDAAAAWASERLEPRLRAPLEHAGDLYLTTTYADEVWAEDVRAAVPATVDAVLAQLPGDVEEVAASAGQEVPRVVFMCGPAGSGKSTVAHRLEADGMVRLSIDSEAWARGHRTMPLPAHVLAQVEQALRARLLAEVRRGQDVVLDLSFWSRRMREEFRALLAPLGVVPEIIHVATDRETVLSRVRARRGSGGDDVRLDEDLAARYYDQFEPPDADEGPITVVPGTRATMGTARTGPTT